MKKIILTGGGSAGHVTPNIALIEDLKKNDYVIKYIGSYNGIEKDLIQNEGIEYIPISSGKLRRYFDFKNFSDPFKVLRGLFQAFLILKKEKPDIVFSKGGFVSVPVVLAARLLKIPVIIHESDMTPGLANKICFSSANKICCNFIETLSYLPKVKAIHTGSPIRKELLTGNSENAKSISGLNDDKPILLIIGGSLGSVIINKSVRACLKDLLKGFNIIHICGKGNIDNNLNNIKGYIQYEYIGSELKDFFAFADIVISRAGANSIAELLAIKKPNILIPLSANASRGDQILNANSYKKQGYSYVLEEENLNENSLLNAINYVYSNKEVYIKNMSLNNEVSSTDIIINLILENSK